MLTSGPCSFPEKVDLERTPALSRKWEMAARGAGMSTHMSPPKQKPPTPRLRVRIYTCVSAIPNILPLAAQLWHSHSLRLSCTGSGRRPHSRTLAQRRGKEANASHMEKVHIHHTAPLNPHGSEEHTHTAGTSCPLHGGASSLTRNPAQRTLHVMRDSTRSRKEAGIATRHVVTAYILLTRKSPAGKTYGLILLTCPIYLLCLI